MPRHKLVSFRQPEDSCGSTMLILQSTLAQLWALSSLIVMGLGTGLSFGWISPGLVKLIDGEDSPFKVDKEEGSWIVSLSMVGVVLGSVVGAAVFNKVGRKANSSLLPITSLISSSLMYFATNVYYIYAARIVIGLGLGTSLVFHNMYVGEVASKNQRGTINAVVNALCSVGFFIQLCVGPFVSYWTQILMCVPGHLIGLLLLVPTAVESPYFLASRGRVAELMESLAHLRALPPDNPAVLEETAHIIKAVESETRAPGWRVLLTELFREHKKSTLLVLFLSGSGPLYGGVVMIQYANYIFLVAGSSIPAEYCAMVLVTLDTLSNGLTMCLVDRVGRRAQLIGSTTVNSVAMAGVGGFFYAKDIALVDVTSVTWLPLACLSMFVVSAGVGTASIPSILAGELLPQESKAVVPVSMNFAVALAGFLTSKLFPVNLAFSFFFFSIWNLLALVVVAVCLPETRGKSLLEIQTLFRRTLRPESAVKD